MTHFSELKKLNYKKQKFILIQTAGSIATTMLINNREPGGRRERGGGTANVQFVNLIIF